ncbi:DUF4184 family protein [Tenacibaculum maritimum]|uniref:DUF4184 family protein n=1 Tax=Tenacibaculum maritimum TaxID=107401 RepID=UPI0012E5D036|nr:DUF4184 family protein [Tenacibaculum maritimum]CAA0177536.1 conserved membrane hypothetical protein [Tenacibaculum maritimum]
MPFTFSHPSIILLFTYLPKKWFSLTGLVIGSLTPDFEYFIRMEIKSTFSHTLIGLLGFNLPLGITLSFIFHNIIKNDLFNNLPHYFKSKFSPFKKFNWNHYFIKNWPIVTTSILIGTVSHIFWDNFTHQNGYFVEKISILRNPIYFFNQRVFAFKILQHTSTIIGAIIITYAIYKLPSSKINGRKNSLSYWALVFGLTFGILFLRFFNEFNLNQYGNIIVACISSFLLSLTLSPLILTKIKRSITNATKKDSDINA